MAMNIIILFQGVQTLSLLVIAMALYNIWRKVEGTPFVTQVESLADEPPLATSSREKRFRAKVYEDLDQRK